MHKSKNLKQVDDLIFFLYILLTEISDTKNLIIKLQKNNEEDKVIKI